MAWQVNFFSEYEQKNLVLASASVASKATHEQHEEYLRKKYDCPGLFLHWVEDGEAEFWMPQDCIDRWEERHQINKPKVRHTSDFGSGGDANPPGTPKPKVTDFFGDVMPHIPGTPHSGMGTNAGKRREIGIS